MCFYAVLEQISKASWTNLSVKTFLKVVKVENENKLYILELLNSIYGNNIQLTINHLQNE